MDSQDVKSKFSKEDLTRQRTEHFSQTSLQEVTLEDRRNEAKKPLFLTRYE